MRGSGPNLWPFVVRGLGFEVVTTVFDDAHFVEMVQQAGFCQRARALSSTSRSRDLTRGVDVVFLSFDVLPGRSIVSYWDRWALPHVFYAPLGWAERPPVGWTHRRQTFSHADLGGSTTARWILEVWYPPDAVPCEPETRPPQPHIPLASRLGDREGARACPPPPGFTTYPREVVREEGGPGVLSWGLFPHNTPEVDIVCACQFSPSGFGRRRATVRELADLWDLSILVSEAVGSRADFGSMVASCCRTPPGKFLQYGADLLLTGGFRGGRAKEDNEVIMENKEVKSRGAEDVTTEEVREDSREVMGDNREPTPVIAVPLASRIDLLPPPTVGRQEGQKADNAEVPTHIWDFFFKESFADQFGRPPPAGWETALDGFRRLAIRFWRRRLLSSYREWRTKHYPLRQEGAGHLVRLDKTSGHYVWTSKSKKRGRGKSLVDVGSQRYRAERRTQAEKPAYQQSMSMAADALTKAAGPYHRDHKLYMRTWWEWVEGSTLFFWRWPERFQSDARDGQPHFMTGDPKPYMRQQRPPTPEEVEKVREKILPVRIRKYIEPGVVRSLIHYFWVSKGVSDIRMVYDGTGCGLNDFIWAMHFGLPTVRHTLRSMLPGYYQCDMDVGEMFLNFMLHEMLRELSGVDISSLRSDDPLFERARSTSYERWCRNWMGLKDSPVRSIAHMTRIKHIAYGDRKDRTNPFHWERVVFNLPGTTGYRPDLPWVMKIRYDGHLACEVYVYVDDGRATGHSRWICWKAISRFSSVCADKGVQDATRKRTCPRLDPDQWAGTMLHADGGELVGLVSDKKWEKTKAKIDELDQLVRLADERKDSTSQERSKIPLKPLLSIRGYLIYVTRTYDWMNPYLKGLHNTISGWRPDYVDGWKLTGREAMMFRRAQQDDQSDEEDEAQGPPEMVEVQDRLRRDIRVLKELTSPAEPPRRKYRSRRILVALHLPGDASGQGFGSALITLTGIEYESGTWEVVWSEKSSNFREADNLVRKIEDLVERGLRGAEIFIYTDNFVFESVYYKGYSKSSEDLSDVILRLYQAARKGDLILHVIWIAGTRMKAMGVDGLSRGDLVDGMMAGMDPLSFVPVAQGADERSRGGVSTWIRSWWQEPGQTGRAAGPWAGAPLVEVTKDNMFELKDVVGPRLWMLPPAVMETVLEMFTDDRTAHPWNAHVFAVPKLMTHLWRKALSKDADILFEVVTGDHFWAREQHEPLLIAIVFPLCHRPDYQGPWALRDCERVRSIAVDLERGFKVHAGKTLRGQSGELLDVEPAMQEMWKTPVRRSRAILLQLLDFARRFPPVQECLVRGLLRGKFEGPVPKASGGGPGGGGRGGRRKRPPTGDEGLGKIQKRQKR